MVKTETTVPIEPAMGMTEVWEAIAVAGVLLAQADDISMLLLMTVIKKARIVMAPRSTVQPSGSVFLATLMHRPCRPAAVKAQAMVAFSAPAMNSERIRHSPFGHLVHLIRP